MWPDPVITIPNMKRAVESVFMYSGATTVETEISEHVMYVHTSCRGFWEPSLRWVTRTGWDQILYLWGAGTSQKVTWVSFQRDYERLVSSVNNPVTKFDHVLRLMFHINDSLLIPDWLVSMRKDQAHEFGISRTRVHRNCVSVPELLTSLEMDFGPPRETLTPEVLTGTEVVSFDGFVDRHQPDRKCPGHFTTVVQPAVYRRYPNQDSARWTMIEVQPLAPESVLVTQDFRYVLTPELQWVVDPSVS